MVFFLAINGGAGAAPPLIMSPVRNPMTISRPSLFLRRVILADALLSGAAGLLMAGAADLLDGLLGIPAALLRAAGLVLLPYAALLTYLSRRDSLSKTAVWIVIAVNTLWAADSVLLLASGWTQPTLLGIVFVMAQAAAVGLFASLQYVGLQRSGAAALA